MTRNVERPATGVAGRPWRLRPALPSRLKLFISVRVGRELAEAAHQMA
jgi:hypothetical protein